MTKILLVDDSRITRELIKVYLIAKDVEILEAADGAEALEVARRRRPDIVLTDLRMPKLDGAALCQAMRADLRTREIPVIILTSSVDEATAGRCRAAGAREVLRLPIQPQPLLEAVGRHLPSFTPPPRADELDRPSPPGGAPRGTGAADVGVRYLARQPGPG
jgi:CheY-like chemotaxis protein